MTHKGRASPFEYGCPNRLLSPKKAFNFAIFVMSAVAGQQLVNMKRGPRWMQLPTWVINLLFATAIRAGRTRLGEVDVNLDDATDDRTAASIIRDLMLLQGQSPISDKEYEAKFVMKELI